MFETILASIRKVVPPIHKEGTPFIAIFAFVTLLLFWLVSTTLGWIGLGLTLWCALFFRDPQRVTPMRDGLVIAPADGVVCMVGLATPPPELGLGDEPLPRVCIFMNVFNVHVNRAPVSGRVIKIAYKPGIFLNADLDKASEDNERNGLVIESNGQKFGVVQIAGLIARRIVCFVRDADLVGAGERFGLIRFGSRVDVYMPQGVKPLAAIGQTMVAGETIIADLTSNQDASPVRIN